MLDNATTGASAPMPRCMWCSAELPSENETVCPSCGATLVDDGEHQVPGVTAIDAEAIVRAARTSRVKPKSRLLSWISGDFEEDTSRPAPGSLSPPPPDVRREILRLELEAQVANLQAEAEAMAADAAVEQSDEQAAHAARAVPQPEPNVLVAPPSPDADAAPAAEDQPPA
jgi:hypothetical protein